MRNREGVASREGPTGIFPCRACLLTMVVFRRIVAVCRNCSRYSCERNNTSITALSDVMSGGWKPRHNTTLSTLDRSRASSPLASRRANSWWMLFGNSWRYSDQLICIQLVKAIKLVKWRCRTRVTCTADLRFTSAFHNAHAIAIDHQTLVDKHSLNVN